MNTPVKRASHAIRDNAPAHEAGDFERHRPRLTDLARGWLGSRADAEDAVQEAWLRSRTGLPASADEAVPWWVAVLRHLCIDRLRRQAVSRRVMAQHAADAQAVQAQAISAEQRVGLAEEAALSLRRVCSRLGPQEAALFLLREVFGYEHGELARLSGRSEAACRQAVRRALHKLQAPDDPRCEPAEAMLSLCWRALRLADPQGLIGLLVRAAPQKTTAVAAAVAAGGRPGAAGAAPQAVARLVQAGGRFAMAWEFDGQVLCTLPLGPAAALELDGVPEESLAAA